MAYSDNELEWMYDRNKGYCFCCGTRLALKNYEAVGKRGAWEEVDHFIPRASRGANQPYLV